MIQTRQTRRKAVVNRLLQNHLIADDLHLTPAEEAVVEVHQISDGCVLLTCRVRVYYAWQVQMSNMQLVLV